MAVLPRITRPPSLLFFALSAICFLLAGCQPTFVAYHATASIPYSATSTATGMELVIGPAENASNREFIVLKARDQRLADQGDAPMEYVLLAPKSNGSMSGYEIPSANLHRSVPFPGETVQTLIDGLGRVDIEGSICRGWASYRSIRSVSPSEMNRCDDTHCALISGTGSPLCFRGKKPTPAGPRTITACLWRPSFGSLEPALRGETCLSATANGTRSINASTGGPRPACGSGCSKRFKIRI